MDPSIWCRHSPKDIPLDPCHRAMIQHGPEASVAEASAPSALTLQPNEALAAAAGRNTASHCCLHRKTSYEILVTIESTMLLDNQMASLTPEIFNCIKRSNFQQVLLLDFNCGQKAENDN